MKKEMTKQEKLEAMGIWMQAAGQGAAFDAWLQKKGAGKK